MDAWITGLRRDQSPGRAGTPKLTWDAAHAKWKAAPLADWSEADVWRYIADHDVPYNPLHDRGFSSIGCAPCTVAGAGRDGRWAGTDKIECGLHPAGRVLMDPAIILFGFGIGVLVGMTGMGGGSLMTPLLILVFGIKPVVAVGTDLSYAAVTKTVGGWRHLKTGIVHRRMALWLAAGSCPGALGGVYVLELLRDAYGDSFDDLVIVLIACALLLTGLLVLLRSLALTDARQERDGLKMETRHKVGAVLLGLSVGFVLGITSAGSGTLIAVGLILGFRLKPHAVVGTDIVHAALLLWVASFAHLISGNVDLGAGGDDPHRLDPGRVDRERARRAGARRLAAADARDRADRVGHGAAVQGGAGGAGGRADRRAGGAGDRHRAGREIENRGACPCLSSRSGRPTSSGRRVS